MNVQRLPVEPLTEAAFRPFGQVLGPADRPPDYRGDGGSYGWRVGFEADGQLRVSVSVAPHQGLRFSRLERHFHVTQTFVPLDGPPAVVAVAPATDPADPEAIPPPGAVRAFLIDGSRGYLLGRGVWHSLDRYPLAPAAATFVVLNEQETARDPTRSQIVDYAARLGITFELAP
jgi:ureidoglycolate lyase